MRDKNVIKWLEDYFQKKKLPIIEFVMIDNSGVTHYATTEVVIADIIEAVKSKHRRIIKKALTFLIEKKRDSSNNIQIFLKDWFISYLNS